MPFSSCLAQISAEDAVDRHPLWQNGLFKVDMSTIAECSSVRQIIPNKVFVPNKFDNVNIHNSTFEVLVYAGVPSTPFTVNCALKQEQVKTWEDLATKLEAALKAGCDASDMPTAIRNAVKSIGGLTFQKGPAGHPGYEDYIFLVSGLASYKFVINASVSFFRLVGWWLEKENINRTGGIPTVVGQRTLTGLEFIGGPPSNGKNNNTPNLSGVQLVHVCLKNVTSGNMVSSNISSHSSNVFITVPLHDTPYGSYACADFSGDIKAGDVNFTTGLSLSDLEVKVLDEEFRPLIVPSNFNVILIVKMFYESQ